MKKNSTMLQGQRWQSVRRPLLRLANRMHKGHLEGGPATMTTNVTRVEQILHVMVKINYCSNSSNSDIRVSITKRVYSCGNNQMLKCSSTYIRKNATAGIISGSYIRDEHKKIISDYKELWTFSIWTRSTYITVLYVTILYFLMVTLLK